MRLTKTLPAGVHPTSPSHVSSAGMDGLYSQQSTVLTTVAVPSASGEQQHQQHQQHQQQHQQQRGVAAWCSISAARLVTTTGAAGVAAASLTAPPDGGMRPGAPNQQQPPAGRHQEGERVEVVCGALRGVLLLPARRVVVGAGTPREQQVSPTEFESLAGKGASKRWRSTIHLADGACAFQVNWGRGWV
jgi:hypothetical protein